MGVKGCKKGEVLWEGKKLNLKMLKLLQVGNRIDVDGNGLAWTMFHGSKVKSFHQLLHSMAEFLMKIAFSGGFVITIIVDGDDRPDCKRDSWSRRKSKELDEVNRVFCRMKSMSLYQKVKSANATEEERREYEEFRKAAKAFESKCSRSNFKIPNDFHIQLSQQLMSLGACIQNENGGYVVETVLKAKFQADSVIAQRSISNKSDFVMSKDSDFPVLIGKDCILLTNIYEKKNGPAQRGRKQKTNKNTDSQKQLKDATMYNVDICGSNNCSMRDLKCKLEAYGFDDSIEWKEAQYPLFQYSNPTLRGTIAVALGCDAYKQGVQGLSYKTIHQMIEKVLKATVQDQQEINEIELTTQLKSAFLKKTKPRLVEAEYDMLVASFLYEPGVVVNDNNDPAYFMSSAAHQPYNSGERILPSDYIHGKLPTCLPPYLQAFASADVQIDATSQVEICNCPGTHCTRAHQYPKFEGSHKCIQCNETFCKTCSFVPSLKEKKKPIQYRDFVPEQPLCLQCFCNIQLGRGGTADNEACQDMKTLDEMIDSLRKDFGVTVDHQAEISETTDIYQTYISCPNNTRQRIMKEVEKVKFPLFPAGVLDGNEAAPGENNDKLSFHEESFSFSQGGRFISDINLVSNDDLPSVLRIFANFVSYDRDDLLAFQADDKRKFDLEKYDHFPTLFLNLAYNS